MSPVAIVARARVEERRVDEYLAAFALSLEQARREPGTLLMPFTVQSRIRRPRRGRDDR